MSRSGVRIPYLAPSEKCVSPYKIKSQTRFLLSRERAAKRRQNEIHRPSFPLPLVPPGALPLWHPSTVCRCVPRRGVRPHAVSLRHHESFLRTVISRAYFSLQLRSVAASSSRSGPLRSSGPLHPPSPSASTAATGVGSARPTICLSFFAAAL